jgi:phosphoribosylaminoimidazolecarboxamide formyltransferase/IMP cyclohydrolase
MSRIPVRRALLSASDKTGLIALAKRLGAAGVELVSSGGTARALAEAGLAVTGVAEVTGAPEMLGGRVKTLHPAIHGGILADLGLDEHRADLDARGIEPFQLVVVNLYPFERTVAAEGTTHAEAVEQIDIGGPTMVRAAAKNHAWVGTVTSPDQYDDVAAAVETGGLGDEMRRSLAAAAFFHTAAYDAAIVRWFERGDDLPERMVIPLERHDTLRYGENPHQAAAVYSRSGSNPWWRRAEQLQGKAMSFNNYADAEAAWRLAASFAEPAAVVVKHTNACGAAVCDTAASAFRKAWDCDPLSAFGGVIAVNRPIDQVTAEAIIANFAEVVIAPSIEEAALPVLATKKNLRVLAAPEPSDTDFDLRRIDHGLLVQDRDRVRTHERETALPEGWSVVAGDSPTAGLLADLEFAWTVAAHTKSNAIVIANNRAAVGVGAGDQSRVGAAERAIARAGDRARGGVAASDAFLPFRDGLDTLAGRGVVALIEPGGSRRDDEVVEAATEHGMTLIFTGRRHFRH